MTPHRHLPSRRATLGLAATMAALAVVALAQPAAAATGDTALVSQLGLNPVSGLRPSVSRDGNIVAFSSSDPNLPGHNGHAQVYVKDRTSGTVRLVSADSAGVPGDAESTAPSVSADGNFVAFDTSATNFGGSCAGPTAAGADCNDRDLDVWVRDLRPNGTMSIVSVNSLGRQANAGNSLEPSVNADGSRIAFTSSAQLGNVPDLNNAQDVFVRDTVAGTTTTVSVKIGGRATGDKRSFAASIDGAGQRIAFASEAGNLELSDQFGQRDVFVRDLTTRKTSLVSLKDNVQGNQQLPVASGDPAISEDGNVVVWDSKGKFVAADTDSASDVYRRDLGVSATELVSTGLGLPVSGFIDARVSSDGNTVSFNSFDAIPGQDPHDTVVVEQAFARKMAQGTIVRLDVNDNGVASDGNVASETAMAGDGATAVFQADGTNLVSGLTNAALRVYAHRL